MGSNLNVMGKTGISLLQTLYDGKEFRFHSKKKRTALNDMVRYVFHKDHSGDHLE